jgi:hypothetical protein
MSLQKPKQLNSRFVLVITRYLSRAHAFAYRISRGRFGGNLRVGAGFRKPAPTLLLDHLGRKSGKRFTTVASGIRCKWACGGSGFGG